MYSTGEFSKLIGVSAKTLERWDKQGKFKAHRTPTGRRFYTQEQYLGYTKQPGKEEINEVYFKVTCNGQDSITSDHINSLNMFCKEFGIQVTGVLTSSPLN